MSDANLPSVDEKLFQVALDARNYEISMFWQRSNYFLVLNSALAVGFFSHQTGTYAWVLALLGLGASLLWIRVNLGGKYWQSRWEHELTLRGQKAFPHESLFGATREQTDEFVNASLRWNNPGTFRRWWNKRILAKPSVSASITYLSVGFLLAWLALLFAQYCSLFELNRRPLEGTEVTMGSWVLSNANATAIQSIATLLSTILTAITIIVLLVTWKAVRRQALAAEDQAAAARALTQVAKDQTAAAFDAAQSAQKQSELLSLQFEQSTAPLIVAELDDSASPSYNLVNRGPGVAFQIYFWIGPLNLKDRNVPYNIGVIEPSTLGPGCSAHLPIPPQWEVITVQYKGLDREERWTIVYDDRFKGQEHVVKKGLKEFYLS